MLLFKCQNCRQVLYFENTNCVKCGFRVGYLPNIGQLSAVEPNGSNWTALADGNQQYRFCENWERHACNWMVNAAENETLCRACQHNRTIPDISDPENLKNWQKIEEAKRRLFYSLIKLQLPIPTTASGDPEPLAFDFLAEQPDGQEKVMTGHDNGLITIALKEADDTAREQARANMGELYRTLLGHLRHEVGHYYWDKLVRDGGEQESFRQLFGDERADYGQALQRHYDSGPPPDWQSSFVSSYATMHPWEDWAETWAHYMHIVDTLEMASAFGISIAPQVADNDETLEADMCFDMHRALPMQQLIDEWLPLTYAVNSLNRSMGQPDLYPFIIPPPVVEKLGYIHQLIYKPSAGQPPEPPQN